MENKVPGNSGSPQTPPPRRPRSNTWTLVLLLTLVMVLILYFTGDRTSRSEITYDFFRQQLGQPKEVVDEHGNTTYEKTDTNVAQVRIQGQLLRGKFVDPPLNPDPKVRGVDGNRPKLNPEFVTYLTPAAVMSEELDRTMRVQGVDVKAEPPADSSAWMMMFYILAMFLFFAIIIFFYRRAQSQMMGGGFLGAFSKSPARRYDDKKSRVTFADVAGLEGVKSDLDEVVQFLKNPQKFRRLGGRIPKGTLLVGPPGTGKTLLARAVAGEAGVPFFSINGSEFIQMFVGVGASRVRDMFQTARENSPCILFIDEIDAVGRVRGAGVGGGHDEREQTLNQILSEMDGFTPDEAVIVLAATNRPDVLDPALLRPGRFDRHVVVDKPNLKAREALFKVHSRGVPLADDVDLPRLARGTVGLTGADIRNLVNEAALNATREGKDKVHMNDFEEARDKVLMGPKREDILEGKEKRMTAFHESGHALLAWIVPGADRVHKVTVVPRGRALGVTQLLPEEDRINVGESRLKAALVFILGGRAAEKLVFNEYSAGAEDDLKKATQLARRMVTAWGMSERLGPVNYVTAEEHPFLGKEIHEHRLFSEHTAQVIDEEVARILHEAADRAYRLLDENRDKLEQLTDALEEKEVLDERDIEEIIGPSVNRRAEHNGRPIVVDDESPAKPLSEL